jgi:hypothetical protein
MLAHGPVLTKAANIDRIEPKWSIGIDWNVQSLLNSIIDAEYGLVS